MPKNKTFAERLKAARSKASLSQSQAANKWGINARTLQGWELGKEPKGLYLEKLEAILKKAGV